MCQARLWGGKFRNRDMKCTQPGKGATLLPFASSLIDWSAATQERPFSCGRNLAWVSFQSLRQTFLPMLLTHEGNERSPFCGCHRAQPSFFGSRGQFWPVCWWPRPLFRMKLSPTASRGLESITMASRVILGSMSRGDLQESSLLGLQHTDKSLVWKEQRYKTWLYLGGGHIGQAIPALHTSSAEER